MVKLLCKIRNIFNYMILNSFQYNDLTYFRKEEKKNGIGNSISAVLSLGN